MMEESMTRVTPLDILKIKNGTTSKYRKLLLEIETSNYECTQENIKKLHDAILNLSVSLMFS